MAADPSREAPTLAQLIARHLPDQDPQVVRAILERYGREAHEREPERVWAGAVELSGGNLQRLGESIAEARVDYRDLLYRLELQRHHD